MKKKKNTSYILTSTEKKQIKQNRILSVLIVLIVISFIFNIIFLLDIRIPYINPNGGFHGFEVSERKSPSILKRVFKDNTRFFDYSSINLDTGKNSYSLTKMDGMCRLYGVEGWDFEYCDFEIAKWDELKDIVLRYQLEEYDPSKHVDSEGRIQNYNVDYSFSIWIGNSNVNLEIPENVEDIEAYLVELTNLARTKYTRETDEKE